MHHKFHTDAFVVGSTPFGEANKIYELFTRDFGMIRASAQGVRLAKSKLKYALQDMSYVRIDLVQGKEFWRITSATHIQQFPDDIKNKKQLYLSSRMTQIVSRLCGGEESHPVLFEEIKKVLYTAQFIPSHESDKYTLFEIGAVFKIVSLIGYAVDREEEIILPSIDHTDFYTEVEKNRVFLVSHINRVLRESQLY